MKKISVGWKDGSIEITNGACDRFDLIEYVRIWKIKGGIYILAGKRTIHFLNRKPWIYVEVNNDDEL